MTRALMFRETGKPTEVLEFRDIQIREPKTGEVRVKMLAAPINPADLNMIEGTYGVQPRLPAVPGIEGCGVIERSEAEGFKAGDRVIFLRRPGSWATRLVVEAAMLFKLPDAMDPLQAAMLKVNPATAWRLLTGFAELKAGDWIVQNAGNSAVGRCVIQLATERAVKSLSFVRRAELGEELRALGGDAVFLDDPAGRAAARELLQGANSPLGFNAVGGDSALGLLKLLKEGGTLVTYGAMGRKPVTVPNGLLIFGAVVLRGLWVTRWLENAPADEVEATYRELAARVAAGKLVQKIDSVYPLADFKAALARLDAADRDGKVLFVPENADG